MPARGLTLLLLAAAATAQNASLPRGGDLGREWAAEEWNTRDLVLKGKWVREGDTARFRVFYSDQKGRPATWTAEILSIEGDEVRLRLHVPLSSGVRTYSATGRIQSDGRTIRGKAEWCGAAVACGFRVVADWKPLARGVAQVAAALPAPKDASPLRAGIRANPGRLWRVTDLTTPGFHWEGTWTFEGETVRFSYREKKSGAQTQGVLELQRWDGAYVRLLNRASKDTYEGQVQADGRTIRGTAQSCGGDPKCRWEAVIEK
ncbi:MAG: hypothetical protein WHT08_10645 [Bryobacteraceae bacterium]|jgi:hypothetical protein